MWVGGGGGFGGSERLVVVVDCPVLYRITDFLRIEVELSDTTYCGMEFVNTYKAVYAMPCRKRQAGTREELL